MSMLKFTSKATLDVFVVVSILLIALSSDLLRASISSNDDSEAKAHSATSQASIDKEYDKLTYKISASESQNRAIELIASGSAATLVGVYGYYFDERGSFAKLAYFATQTAGIFVLGEGIRKYHSRNLVLDLQTDSASLSRNSLKQIVVENDYHNRYAKHRADAWTAGLLGGLYAYNAYRTTNDVTNVRSIYIFLAANAIAVCGYNTYQILTFNQSSSLQTQFGLSGFQVTWKF